MAFLNSLASLVRETYPVNGSVDVPVTELIRVTFALDMLPETINSSTIVLLDDASNRVESQVVYADRIATLTPTSPLRPATRYQVIVKGGQSGVKSITSSILLTDFNFNFETTAVGFLSKALLISPADGSLINEIPQFSWKPIDGALSYDFQISKEPDFASLVFSSNLVGTSIRPDAALLEDQIYYWRVKGTGASDGIWSDVWQFRYSALQANIPEISFDLVEVSPKPDELFVNIDVVNIPFVITALFTDNVDASTVTPNTFQVFREDLSRPGEKEIVPGFFDSSSGNQISFLPAEMQYNSLYTVVIRKGITSVSGSKLYDDILWSFCTKLSPYYSSIDLIRTDMGGFVEDISDLDIAKTIYQVSLWADQIAAKPYGSLNDDFLGETQQKTTNEIFFHEYVRYETELRLLSRRTMEHMQDHGTTRQIGDLVVKASGSMVPDINVTLKRLEALRNKAEKQLTMGRYTFALPMSVVKGEALYPYPITPRRSF